MNKKIVFLDVDGTLINYHAELPESAARAVEEARANGHRVYICTGCSKAEIEQRHLCELDGMIGGNGAYVEDHGHVVMHQGLSKEETKHIVDWCCERHLDFYLEANSGMYCNDLAQRFSYSALPRDKWEVIETIPAAADYLRDNGSEPLYVVTCFSDRDKLLAHVEKEG